MSFSGPIEDRLAIRELIETYADAVCQVDAQGWGATWAVDGDRELPGGLGQVSGVTPMVAAWKEAMANFPGVVFAVAIGSIEVSGDRARACSYTSEVYTDKTGVTHRDRGQYEDVVVKASGRWLLKSRRFHYPHQTADQTSATI